LPKECVAQTPLPCVKRSTTRCACGTLPDRQGLATSPGSTPILRPRAMTGTL
jgi:hypothetical protein